jgi:aldehyde oxidoreductase
MKAEGIPTKYRGAYDTKGDWADVDPDTGHGYGAFSQNYGLFIADVEVDMASGKARVMHMHVCADVGVIGNPLGVLGQAYGGISHSIGYALTEDYEDLKKHATFRGGGVPTCNEIPDDIEVDFHITPRENGPYGSTGSSECFQSSGHVAVLNAIARATGVRIYCIPATPDKMKAGLEALSRGEEPKQEKWDLGCDMYERLDYMKTHLWNRN